MRKRRAQVVAGAAPRGAASIYNRDLAPIGVRLLQHAAYLACPGLDQTS